MVFVIRLMILAMKLNDSHEIDDAHEIDYVDHDSDGHETDGHETTRQ